MEYLIEEFYSEHFNYSTRKHSLFAKLYERKVELKRSMHVSNSTKVYKLEEDDKWKLYWVKKTDHLKAVQDLLTEENSWWTVVNNYGQIPSPIFRSIRASGKIFSDYFPSIMEFDEEYQPPYWLEFIHNTKRFSVYTKSVLEKKRKRVENFEFKKKPKHKKEPQMPDYYDEFEDELDDEQCSSLYSEFTWIENQKIWKQFFHRPTARVETLGLEGIRETDIHPHALSAVIYVMAWKLDRDHACEIYDGIVRKLRQPVKLNNHRNEVDDLVDEIKAYLKGTIHVSNEIRNLFIHFDNIGYVSENIVSFREIKFRNVKYTSKTYVDENTVILKFPRSIVSPIQLTSTMLLLNKRYANRFSENYVISYSSTECILEIHKEYFRKVQLIYVPHLLMTHRYGKDMQITATLYPLITWIYLYGDDDDMRLCFLTFLSLVKQYSGGKKIVSRSKNSVHRLFHVMLRRLAPEHQSDCFVTLFRTPYNEIDNLHFGPSSYTQRKRKRDNGMLDILPEEEFFTGFNIHTHNIYTGLDAFISLKEKQTVITRNIYFDLASTFQKLDPSVRKAFPHLDYFLFERQFITDERYFFINDQRTLEEIYLFSMSKHVSDENFLNIFTRLKYVPKASRISSLTTHLIPQMDNFNNISEQRHLKTYTLSEEDKEYLLEERKVTLNDIQRLFYFFKAVECIVRYPVKFHFGAISTFCWMKEEVSILSLGGAPYRGQVYNMVEFETIPVSVCNSRKNPPNIVITEHKRQKQKLLEVFPILDVEKTEGRSLSRDNQHDELPPIIDSDPNFFQTIILKPCTFVNLQ